MLQKALLGAGLCVGLALSAAYPVAIAETGTTMVRTESGKVRCSVGFAEVTCQRQFGETFPSSPYISGYMANQASIRSAGSFQWLSAQLPAIEQYEPRYDIVLAYGQPQHVNGWAIEPTFGGTTFTNTQTRRGMFVSIDEVTTF